MHSEEQQNKLVCRALEGDRDALNTVLAVYCPRLTSHFGPRLPVDLKGLLSIEDVLQEGFADVFRSIAGFRSGPAAFYGWVVSIVEHRLLDLIRAARAVKRGGDWGRLDAESTQVAGLLEQAAAITRTPSISVAGHEAVAAVQEAMARLPADYRQALQLRHIEGLSAAEAAARMGRTEAAVHMLCQRGLRQMVGLLGSESRFFSRKA